LGCYCIWEQNDEKILLYREIEVTNEALNYLYSLPMIKELIVLSLAGIGLYDKA
jgi:hypothetical protein